MGKEEKVKQSAVAIPLSSKNRRLLVIGCCSLMLFIASGGAALAILQTPMLTEMGMIHQFSIVTIAGTVGLCIMTPIGGKLGDIFGRKQVIIISAVICLAALIGIAFLRTFPIYIFLRVLLAAAQGAFTSAPYILMSQIFEQKEVPKYMGILSSSVAFGTFGGAFLAGAFADQGQLAIGVSFSALFLIIAIITISISLPNIKSTTKLKFDSIGTLFLTIFIAALVLTLNYGSQLGWLSMPILVGIALTVLSGIILVKVETKLERNGESPLISITLLKNLEYSILLIIGLSAYFYQTIMLNYGSLAAMQILKTSAATAGALTMPRTIVSMILPTITGIWLGKNKKNSWKAIALSGGIVALALIPVLFISPTLSILVLFTSFTITGVAESFRAVSITPAAQQLLTPENLSTGTALINFTNSFASVFGAAVSGSLYSSAGDDMIKGIKLVFGCAIAVATIGCLLALFYVRPRQLARIKKEESAQPKIA